MVATICDQQVARRIEGNAVCAAELGDGRRTAIARVFRIDSGITAARYRPDHAGLRRHLADCRPTRNVEVASYVECKAIGKDLRAGRWAAVATVPAVALGSVASHCRDDAGARRYLADAPGLIPNEEIAGAVT